MGMGCWGSWGAPDPPRAGVQDGLQRGGVPHLAPKGGSSGAEPPARMLPEQRAAPRSGAGLSLPVPPPAAAPCAQPCTLSLFEQVKKPEPPKIATKVTSLSIL